MKTSTVQSKAQRFLEGSAIAGVLVLSALIAVEILLAIHHPAALLVALCALPAGYVLSDFTSGLIHFLADNFGDPETPYFGKNFIRPFREHHVDPKGITRHDFIEVNGAACILSFPVLLATWKWLLPETGDASAFFFPALILSHALSTLATNQIHKWAHQERPPRFVKKLQSWGAILSPKHHEVHHTAPFDRHYCITAGWLNGPLARIKFFESIEWLLGKKKKEPAGAVPA
ncbi:MAG: fatty acid desaturase CarF family protein [Bdellovibrionota bacterium]